MAYLTGKLEGDMKSMKGTMDTVKSVTDDVTRLKQAGMGGLAVTGLALPAKGPDQAGVSRLGVDRPDFLPLLYEFAFDGDAEQLRWFRILCRLVAGSCRILFDLIADRLCNLASLTEARHGEVKNLN